MTAVKFGARACAAAFVLGVSLAPQVAGVAEADTPDTDPAPITSGAPATQSTQRPGRAERQSAAQARASAPEAASVTSQTRRPERSPRPGPASASRTARPSAPSTDGPLTAVAVPTVPSAAAVAPAGSSAAGSAAAISAPAAVSSGNAGCAACWGTEATTISAAINTVINHLFNSTFAWLSTLPGGPVANLLEGALVLVRRSLFLSPEGVEATLVGNSLTVSVNTGSVAYFRQAGTSVQVSGDPWFLGAKEFDAASVAAVEVANSPGNAGCAGLIVESGIVNATLQTSQIDAIRFGPGAAFTGAVQSSVSGGPLVLRDAVRSSTGVLLNAPVVLANDVEVDGGNGYATFTGTVDAAAAGKQSLTVTALGTTTFAGAVGGQAALASILTRGIAPLDIQQSADTKTVPLHFLPQFAPNGPAEVKYGIDVAIGDNPSQVYEFDTGGTQFWAGYNPSLWNGVSLTPYGVSAVYTSGNYYDGVVSNTKITIGQGSQTVSTAQAIGISAILAGGNPKGDQVFDFTNPLVPPVESHFFGDFGASFATGMATGLDTPLTSPLFQLPGNLSSGFLVQLGPIGIDPTLTVGVTDALRAQFPYAVPVAALAGGGTYPVSGYQVLQSFGFAPQYYAQADGGPKQPIGTQTACPGAICLATLIDSGQPSTGVRLGLAGGPFDIGGQLQPGVNFIAEFPTTQGRPPLQWTFAAGKTVSVDLVNYQKGSVADKNQNVNTGLNLYNFYDIMFDVAKQVIWLRPTGGQSNVIAGSVTTAGDQSYRQNATLNGTYSTGGGKFNVAGGTILAGDTVIEAGAGDVTFSGTLDGPHALAVNSSGATTFVRQVGGENALRSLTTDAGGSTATASVLTGGNQTYGDPLTLSGEYLLTKGSFTAAGNAYLDGPVTITVEERSGAITFTGNLDAQEGRGYSMAMFIGEDGRVNLNGDVGATNPLGGLAVTSSAGVGRTGAFNARGTIVLDGRLGFAAQDGLSLSSLAGAQVTAGGRIQNFTGNGIVLSQVGPTYIGSLIVSTNAAAGIKVLGAEGLSLSGNSVIANGANGIELADAANAQVLNNAVTGNVGNGIQATASNAVEIANNTVSTHTANGVVSVGSTAVTVSGNTMRNNNGTGVIVGSQAVGNRIESNSIYGNGGTNGAGITLADGGNLGQPAPVITSVALNGSTLIVYTTVVAIPGYVGDFTVQVFYTPAGSATAPQGQQLLYSEGGVMAGTNPLSFAVTGLVAGGVITVTATSAAGNTSEFSNGALLATSS